ncbi:carbohydrate ABC transporter permease [Streptomyces sp. NPDC051940]|uniref:carbohydrate ABC transporter permease n=1 Tax=Streptomyces sp. NPDC051940 TaxID=3155675 RepID=UPI003430C0C4
MTLVTDRAATGRTAPGKPPRLRGRRRSPVFDAPTPLGIAGRYGALVLMVLLTIGPLLWQLSTSLKSKSEDIYAETPQLLPQDPTFANYGEVTRVVPVLDFATNSLIVAAMSVLGNLIGATLAGFALARVDFRGRKLVVGLFMATLVLPGEATIISQFQTVNNLGLTDTLVGIVLPGLIGTVNVLLMYNAFRSLPRELDDAAVIDGATVWQRLRHIGLPAVKGTLSIVAILCFIGAWDDFLWPLLVVQDPEKLTLTVGLAYLKGQFSADPRLIAAGTVIALVPVLVLFATLQRYFFRGVEEGAVKG